MPTQLKFLEIGNYPPPMCGWAMETKLVVDHLRRTGCTCEVLKINENRKVKDPGYVDVQDGFDYLRKICRFAFLGYQFHVHVNGESPKGYLLALLALLVGRLVRAPGLLTFHGGLPQTYFPRTRFSPVWFAFKTLFQMAGRVRCDSNEIKWAIESYGLKPNRVTAIAAFSSQYLSFSPADLVPETEAFLSSRHPVFFCYVSFRPEYRLEVLREAMRRFRVHSPEAGFIWLGFPDKELPAAQKFLQDWQQDERDSLLLLGNLGHDEFLTLLQRCFACIRTPACDGVSASVLEALAMGVPIVASENNRRPEGVITYQQDDANDLCSKLVTVTLTYGQPRRVPTLVTAEDNVQRIADWLHFKAGSFVHDQSTPGCA